jgi:hypothetical protein
MHDPLTVAFEIRYPWKKYGKRGRTEFERNYRESFITIWHKDPERDGSDDSCGWFKRARHGSPEVLATIRKSFEFDWDASYGGWFGSDGRPNFSSSAIALGMFRRAAHDHFEDWGKTDRFMRRRLYDILLFAENPTDSLHDFIIGKHGFPDRERRISAAASMVYGCILRWSLPWWRHPRWHVHHWRLQIHPWQTLRRRFWDKCSRCGKRGFPKGVSAMGDWSGTRIWHDTCDETRAAAVQGAA